MMRVKTRAKPDKDALPKLLDEDAERRRIESIDERIEEERIENEKLKSFNKEWGLINDRKTKGNIRKDI